MKEADGGPASVRVLTKGERAGMGKSKFIRWRVTFTGQVQHVGFRYTAFYLARDLKLTGWVRNQEDGSVLLEAQGPVSDLRMLVLRLKAQPHLWIHKADIQEIPVRPMEFRFAVQ